MVALEWLIFVIVTIVPLSFSSGMTGDKFQLGAEYEPGVYIVEWWRDNRSWTPVFETCTPPTAKSWDKPSTYYAPRACKQFGYLGGWEEVIAVEDTSYKKPNATRINCDHAEISPCVPQVPNCIAEKIGGVRCYNSTRARRISGNLSAAYIDMIEAQDSSGKWLKVCHTNEHFESISLCQELGLKKAPIVERDSLCEIQITGIRLFDCESKQDGMTIFGHCGVICKDAESDGKCADPGDIPHGSRQFDDDADGVLGSTITYNCNSGYEMHGPSRLECVVQRTGESGDGNYRWDNDVPTCIQEDSSASTTSSHSSSLPSKTAIPESQTDDMFLVKIVLISIIAITSAITVVSLIYIIYIACFVLKNKDIINGNQRVNLNS